MSEEKIRAVLEEARGVIASNRLVLGEYMGVRYIGELERKIAAALAEPIELVYMQEDVNEMTSDMIRLRKDYEKVAFKKGAETMKEIAARACESVAKETRSALARPHESTAAVGADECAVRVRNLQIPESDT